MKIIKKLSALLLVCILAFGAVGCHKKNEVAVTIDGLEFTSAYYMNALMLADSEAKKLVDESLDSEETDVDYLSQKVEDKKFEVWVKDRAIEYLKEIAAYKFLCEKADLKVDDETVTSIKSSADEYWDYEYNNVKLYKNFYESNGIGKETYIDFMIDGHYADIYFEHLYGEDGEKAVSQDEITTKLSENYIAANILDVTFSEETDDEKAAIKSKLDTYLTNLKSGKTTFESVYKEYYEITDEETEETESDEPAPQDKYATVIGSEDTENASEYFEDVKEMALGEIKLIEKEESAGYVLVIKKDILADSYYADNLDMTVRHLIKDEEFEKDITEYTKKLDTKISKYAINQFKVKNIKEFTY